MIVHIILKHPFPYGNAMTNRALFYAKGLKAYGVDCKIVVPTALDSYKSINNRELKGIYEGVEFLYTPPKTYRSKYFLVRRYCDFIGYVGLLVYLLTKTRKNDVVIGTAITSLNYFFIKQLCRLRSLKLVDELNEIPYMSMTLTEEIKKKRTRFFKRKFKWFDGHIVISETLHDVARKYSGSPAVRIPIIIDADIATGIKNDTSPVKPPFIFHSGSLTEKKDGICGMLEAFGIAKPKLPRDTMFILTGNIDKSPDKERIEEIIARFNLQDSVDFVGYLDYDNLRRYQKYCSLVIINKYATDQNKYCFATKAGEYIAFSRPIIMTSVGEAMNYFKDNENAYIVNPGNPDLIAEKIVHIFYNKEDAKRVGENGRKLADKEFSYIYNGKLLAEFLKTL